MCVTNMKILRNDWRNILITKCSEASDLSSASHNTSNAPVSSNRDMIVGSGIGLYVLCDVFSWQIIELYNAPGHI